MQDNIRSIIQHRYWHHCRVIRTEGAAEGLWLSRCSQLGQPFTRMPGNADLAVEDSGKIVQNNPGLLDMIDLSGKNEVTVTIGYPITLRDDPPSCPSLAALLHRRPQEILKYVN
jgi:hypothetical protein